MKVLILTLGSRGDVQPFVALGKALTTRGHAVTLSTGRGFEPTIEAAGLVPAPLGIDLRRLLETPGMRRALHSLRHRYKVWRETAPLLRRLPGEMWRIARGLRPDLIVYNVKAIAATDIAARLGVPALPAFQIPAFMPTGDFPFPLAALPDLGRWGNRAGHRLMLRLMSFGGRAMLKPWRAGMTDSGNAFAEDLYRGHSPRDSAPPRLHGYSRHLVPGTSAWPSHERITGYWFSEPDAAWQPPPSLERFLSEGAPPVYIGFGSMVTVEPAVLAATVLDAVRATGRRALLARGWGALETVKSVPDVHVLDAAPHDWLFPRCSAVVHHGGAGTTHEGLRWGRPTVVCPVFGDQPFWGRRVQALGAGPAPLRLRGLKADALAGAIEAAHRPDAAKAAESLGAAIRAEGGAAEAAAVISEVLEREGQ